MELIVGTLLVIFLVAGTGAHFSPRTLFEMGVLREEPPPCSRVDDFQLQSEGEPPRGKGATYDPESYRCERQIFEYGERDSFFDFVTLHAPARLKRLGSNLLKQKSAGVSWTVTVTDDDPHIESYVRGVAFTELTKILGPGALHRNGGDRLIIIEVRRVTDPAMLFAVTIVNNRPKVAMGQ